ETQVGRQLLVERSFQKCDGRPVFRRERKRVTDKMFSAELKIDNLFERRPLLSQTRKERIALLLLEGGGEQPLGVGWIKKGNLQIGVNFDFPGETVVDMKCGTEPRNRIGREKRRYRHGIKFLIQDDKRVGRSVCFRLVRQLRKRKR